jgi:DNA-binding transcriptional MerR regulator
MTSPTQRTIRTAAAEVGIAPGTLRDYERLGLLQVRRDSSGRRLYGDGEIARARAIHEHRRAGRGKGLRRGSPAKS